MPPLLLHDSRLRYTKSERRSPVRSTVPHTICDTQHPTKLYPRAPVAPAHSIRIQRKETARTHTSHARSLTQLAPHPVCGTHVRIIHLPDWRTHGRRTQARSVCHMRCAPPPPIWPSFPSPRHREHPHILGSCCGCWRRHSCVWRMRTPLARRLERILPSRRGEGAALAAISSHAVRRAPLP